MLYFKHFVIFVNNCFKNCFELKLGYFLQEIKSNMKPEVFEQLATEFGSPLYVYDAEKNCLSNTIV